jgi:hypothetical protein
MFLPAVIVEINKKVLPIKGIVSRDWGSLLMLWLNRSEVKSIPISVYFQFKCCFTLKFFKKNGVRLGAL